MIQLLTAALAAAAMAPSAPAHGAPPRPAAVAPSPAGHADADALLATARVASTTLRPKAVLAAWKAALDAVTAAYPAVSPQSAEAWCGYADALHGAMVSDEALDAARKAKAIADKLPGADPRLLADVTGVLAAILAARQEFDEARPLYETSLAYRIKAWPAGDPKIAWANAELAMVDIRSGDLGPGPMARLAAAVAVEHATLPRGDATRIGHAVNYGSVLALANQHKEAEPILRAAAEEARLLPDDNATRSLALGELGTAMLMQGRVSEAGDLFEQSIAVGRRSEGERPEVLADLIGSLAYVRMTQERPEDAEVLFLEARGMFQQSGAMTNAASSLLGAGTAAAARGDRRLGFQRRREALDVVLAQPNPNKVAVGLFQFKLADSYAHIGDLKTAETMEADALEVIKQIRPEGHYQRLSSTITLGWIKALDGKTDEGLALVRPAVERTVVDNRRLEIAASKTTGVQENLDVFGKALQAAYLGHDRDFGFFIAQVLIESDAGRAAAAENARLSAGSGALADTLRRRQTLTAERLRLDGEYLQALSADAARSAGIAERIRQIDVEAAAAQQILDRDFPDHVALVRPEPIAIADAQRRLKPGEVLVVPVATDYGLFVFALSSKAVAWDRSDLTRRQVRELIRRIRLGIDASGPVRSAVDASGGSAPGLAAFDRKAAHALYQAIFTPQIKRVASGASLYSIAADPVFSALPFALLVTAPPTGDDADPATLRSTPWLVRDAAIQVAPSIPAMRAAGKASSGETRFFGAGAPALQGTASIKTAQAYFRGAAGDLVEVKSLPSLPGAGRELSAMARAFGPRESLVLTGEEATETAVKAADLSRIQVVAFATHGLVAGDMEGLSEPALVFTPPASASVLDDALLTASEAATLKLDADWVILSACNTAAGGSAGAPGYTGLARAFMFAGAQSVLVSHWPVRDDAAARLTVDTVRRTARGEAPAQALRHAMLSLMDDRKLAGAFDPSVWGPFVSIGR